MRLRPASWLSVLALLAACVAPPALARDDGFVGTQGPAFMRNQLPNQGLGVAGASRQVPGVPTADKNITQSASENVDPTWSPDGRQIVFASNRDGDYNIYICRADGSNPDTGAALSPKLFSGMAGDERYPAWNPGGMDIAYLRSNAIYVRNLRTSLETRLIDGLTNAQGLSYSPDGTRLVFAARLSGDADLNLYWVATDPTAIDPRTGKPQMVKITDAVGNEVNPCWFPNQDTSNPAQILFAANTLGDYDIYRVAPPVVGAQPVPVTAAQRVIGTGGDGDQRYPCWMPEDAAGALDPYYVVYADNAGGDFDLKAYNPNLDPATSTIYAGPGDQVQPAGSPLVDPTLSQVVYSGKKPKVTQAQLYVIEAYDNTPPILSDGISTRLPTVSPQRAFGGSTVTISAYVWDKGSGVATAPLDSDGDGIADSGVWAILRVADQPVFLRANRGAPSGASTILGTQDYQTTNSQYEMEQMLVDVPSSTGGFLATVDPTDPANFGSTIVEITDPFDSLEALDFVQRIGLPMYDDGTHGDVTAEDGLYTAQWVCPSEAQDYYVDIVPADMRGNAPIDSALGYKTGQAWNPLADYFSQGDSTSASSPWHLGLYAIGYDHVAGFTTRQLDVTRRILFVSDYGAGQKYLSADFAASDLAALSRYWPVAVPTEHYWFSTDDVTGGESPTAHTLFRPAVTRPAACDGVTRILWGAAGSVFANDGIPFPQESLPDRRTSTPMAFETLGGTAPFAGPDRVDNMAIWRILCRGPVDVGTLGYYTPVPLPAIEGSPLPRILDADGMVIWTSPYCGDVFAQPGTLLDASTQSALRSFVSSGGSLLVSGQDVAWALTRNGAQSSPFLSEVLKAGFVSDAPQSVIETPIYGTWPGDRNSLAPVNGALAVENDVYQFINAGGFANPVRQSLTLRYWSTTSDHGALDDFIDPLRLNGGGRAFSSDGCPNAWYIDDVNAVAGGQMTYTYSAGGAGGMIRSFDRTTGGRTVYTSFGMESVLGDWVWCGHPNNTRFICSKSNRVKLLSNLSDYLRTGGVRGKVVSTDGVTPMGGVTVEARLGTGTNGAVMGRTTSLSDGTYLIEGLSAGDYSFFVVSGEYTADHRPTQRIFGGQISESSDLTMRLLRFLTAALYGVVSDASGQPVAGATVTATLVTAGSNPISYTTTTNTDGQYSLDLPTGTYTVVASAPGAASTTITDVQMQAGADKQLDIQLQSSPGVLTGTISGPDGPVGGATVVAASGGATMASAITDASGKYTMNISAGTYELVVTAPGFQQARQAGVVVVSGQTTTADLTLVAVAPGSMAGLVSLQGSTQALGAVTVSLLSGGQVIRTVTTAATVTTQGGVTYNWRIDDVPAGTYDVRVSGQGYAPQTKTGVVVTTGKLTGGVDFTLQPLHIFIAGVTMMSMPFDYNTVAPDAQTLLDDDNNPATPLRLATWVTPAKSYVYYPQSPAKTFALGRGYFMKLAANEPLVREGVRATTSGQGYDIPLGDGWNLLGCPYEFPVDLFSCQVLMQTGGGAAQVFSFQDAVTRGLVGGTLYTLNFGAYQQVYRMDPYTGYWLRCYKPAGGAIMSLRVPPKPLGGVAAPRSRSQATAANWQATVVARSTAGVTARATFGVSAQAGDVYDGADRAQPPTPPIDGVQWLELGFPHDDWGRYAGVYDTDIRAGGRQLRWELELKGGQAGEVVSLSWPELGASVPAGQRVVLEDLQTGLRRSMRHTTAYSVKSDGNPRRFAISVEPDDDRAAITNLSYAATRGVGGEVRFNLSAPLRATAVVRGLNGQVVRYLLRDQQLTAGAQAVVWDGNDDAGRTAPDGTYRLEVVGVSETGEQVRAQAVVQQRR